MSQRAITPLFSGNRLLFWPLLAAVLPAAFLMPFAWTPTSVQDVLFLGGIELTLTMLVLVAWDPLRYHGAGRLLLALLAVGLGLLALDATTLEVAGADPTLALGTRLFAALLIFPCARYAVTGRFERRPDAADIRRLSYGALEVQGTRIVYHDPEDGWELDLDELRLVGEYTLDSWGTDYFLGFVRDADGKWLEAPWFVEGRAAALEHLGELLGTRIEGALDDSTTFKSRALWPPELEGEPWLEETGRPTGPMGRLLAGLARGDDVAHVSPELLERLQDASPEQDPATDVPETPAD